MNTSLIKELRDLSGAGLMDCKKALEASNNDIDEAIDYLRKKGISKAAKKADRIAAEGLSTVVIDGNNASIVEVNCETDFVAKNEKFVNLVNKIAELIVKNDVKTMEEAMSLSTEEGTLNDTIVNFTATIGEKISFIPNEEQKILNEMILNKEIKLNEKLIRKIRNTLAIKKLDKPGQHLSKEEIIDVIGDKSKIKLDIIENITITFSKEEVMRYFRDYKYESEIKAYIVKKLENT